MNTKTFAPTLKGSPDDKGSLSFVVATLNEIDRDGDVTLPGFFGKGVTVPLLPAHDWDHVPLGKGLLREEGDEVIVDAQFNLAIPEAKSWYEAVKFDLEHPPAVQEYSYGFSIRKGGAELGEFKGQRVRYLKALPDGSPGADVMEVSTVLKGAGINTRTLAVKSGLKFAEHCASVVADVKGLRERASEVVALRAEKGKAMSDESAEMLRAVEAELKAFAELLAVPATTDNDNDLLASLWLQFVALDHARSM